MDLARTAARRIARLPLILASAFVVAFIGLPLLAMLWQTVASPEGITFAAYRAVLADAVDRDELAASIKLGIVATAIACAFGGGHAWLTTRTDLPFARALGPLGIAPLAMPPILVAMGFADFADVSGFWACAVLLGVSYAPFVAVLTARGLRSVDGRLYEAAWLARGRGRAERLLGRMVLPEVLAGCLFAFVFVVSEHGVPEFLTFKGKQWHTYAEGVFRRWGLRAVGGTHQELAAPLVAALPLVALIALALVVALRLRARTTFRGDFQELPLRPLGRWRWPALLLPVVYLGSGVGVPVVVMGLWAAGSTNLTEPMSVAVLRRSFHMAVVEASDNLMFTVGVAVATALVVIAVALPLARIAARRLAAIDHLSVVPLAVPGILLAIGFVHVYNSAAAAELYARTGDFYDSAGIVVAAYGARFLPFGVLTLSGAVRRLPRSIDEAAQLSGRGALARAARIHGPLLLPAAWSAACLIFVLALRELDIAVVLPAGNPAVVRRLSNIVHYGGEDMGGALALLLLLVAVLVPLVTVLVTGRKLRPLS